MLSKDDVAKFYELDQRRKKLAREIDAIEREQAGPKEKIKTHVRDHGGSDRTTTFHGYVLSLRSVAGVPAWKTAFVEQCGAAAAEKLANKTPPREVLTVEEKADG